MPIRPIAAVLVAILLSSSPASAEPPERPSPEVGREIAAAFGDLLRADGRAASERLAAIADDKLPPKALAARECVLARLGQRPIEEHRDRSSDNPFLAQVLEAYRAYWRDAAMEPDRRAAHEEVLAASLTQLLALSDGADPFEALPARIEQEGGDAITGRTGYLRDLILWQRDDLREELVMLPEGLQAAQVHYLDDFLSRGWSNYLSCNRSGTGGWTTKDGLFVIVPAYETLSDENFRISYLVHEGQHFWDNAHYPRLASWELEYRAKLAEFVYTVDNRARLLAQFGSNLGDDPAEAHSYANALVLAELRRRLGLARDASLDAVSIPDLQEAAKRALWADSAKRGTEAMEP